MFNVNYLRYSYINVTSNNRNWKFFFDSKIAEIEYFNFTEQEGSLPLK